MTPVEVEVSKHIEALCRDADRHDKECCETPNGRCDSNRHQMVACLMATLNLDLSDLGFIAEAWLDIQCDADETIPDNDSVLDAKEIGE